jgi:hypothetical protein
MSYKQVITAQAKTAKEHKGGQYLRYGFDDLYPQHLIGAVAASATLSMGIDKRAKFIEGNGTKDESFYKAKINYKGHTVDELLKKIAADQAQFEGFALHIQYNGLFEVSSVTHVPFENCRQGEPDDWDFISKIYVVRKLDAFQKHLRAKQNKELCYDVFNPDPEVVAAQVAKYGDITKYPGQILYAFRDKPGARFYPRPVYDAVLTQAETEAGIIKSLHRDVKRGFSLRYLISEVGHENLPTQEVLDRDAEDYKALMGEEGAAAIVRYVKDETSKTIIDKVEAPDLDKLYAFSASKVKEDILHTIGIPQLLYGIQTAGKLGTADEFKEAVNYVTRFVVNQDQRLIERSFKAIFEHFVHEVCPTKDYSIQNLTVEQVMAQTAMQENGLMQDPNDPSAPKEGEQPQDPNQEKKPNGNNPFNRQDAA